MRKLSEKDGRHAVTALAICTATGLIISRYVAVNAWMSVMLSAAVMIVMTYIMLSLFKSPMRQVLYEKKADGYDTQWERLVVRYTYLMCLCIASCTLSCFLVPEWILAPVILYVAVCSMSSVWHIGTVLMREIND